MIFTAIYILYMVGKVVFGPVRLPGQDDEDAHKISIKDLSAREVAVLAPIAVMCLVLGLYPKPVLQKHRADDESAGSDRRPGSAVR